MNYQSPAKWNGINLQQSGMESFQLHMCMIYTAEILCLAFQCILSCSLHCSVKAKPHQLCHI